MSSIRTFLAIHHNEMHLNVLRPILAEDDGNWPEMRLSNLGYFTISGMAVSLARGGSFQLLFPNHEDEDFKMYSIDLTGG